MRWRTWLGGGGILGIGAVALFSTASVCGCEPAEVTLAWQLGIETTNFQEVHNLTTDDLRRAAIAKFRGQPLAMLAAPDAGREGECKRVAPARQDCLYWFEAGLLRKEGRLISFLADGNGLVADAEVSAIRRWKLSGLNAR